MNRFDSKYNHLFGKDCVLGIFFNNFHKRTGRLASLNVLYYWWMSEELGYFLRLFSALFYNSFCVERQRNRIFVGKLIEITHYENE